MLLDPHTLVLDEATSLLDPRAARLQTAHDADRVAVVDDGLITELGAHDELVAAGGDYAALWHSWQQD